MEDNKQFANKVDLLTEYVNDEMWRKEGKAVPSLASAAIYIGVTAKTLREWSKKDPYIQNLVEMIMTVQEVELINGGLLEEFNGGITKLLLSKHGYTDKVDHTSSDNSMTPQAVTIDVSKLSTESLKELVNASNDE